MLSPAADPSASFSSTSSASLRRSISTPTTLFSLKTLSLDDSTTNQKILKHNSSITLHRLLNKISTENFAKQITLIDWMIFSKITRNELKPGQWTGPMKHVLSPNIVLFTRRFNIVTYWVIDEVLNLKTPKQRAEIISFFIKLINNLIELRNLHSSYAIKSALNSASIHRLEKTWNCLSKKDRQCFEKIDGLFSESDNSNKLRNFMETAVKSSKNQNCIPNLATYLRDIIHIDSAYPQSEIHLANYRIEKLESIYNFIEKCQQSNFEEFDVIEEVYNYLVSMRYIEELQKFREDDYYKTSLKLEPDPNPDSKKKLGYTRFNSHYDIRALQQQNENLYMNIHNQSNLELDRLNINHADYVDLLNKSFNEECFKSKTESSTNNVNNGDFKPGHRKTYSLETSHLLSTINNNHSTMDKSRNLKFNLIDDSLIVNDNMNTYYVSQINNKKDKKPTLEMFKKKPDDSLFLNQNGKASNLDELHNEYPRIYTDKDIIFEGCVNRKTILKDKKKPPFSLWNNYHLKLANDSLLFYNNKSNQTKETHHRSCKQFPLLEWSAFEETYKNSNGTNVFTLADHTCSTVYKIRTASESEAKEWIRLIKETTNRLRRFYI